MDDNVLLRPYSIDRPARLVKAPPWPDDVQDVITAAVVGARGGGFPIALQFDFKDGTVMYISYETARNSHTPASVYGNVGEPPLLTMIVIDNGVGIDRVTGALVREHEAEKRLREIIEHIGKDRAKAVFGETMNPRKTRRQYWIKLDA